MNKIEDVLALCMDDIKANRSTVADCLDRHPDMRQELEPLLTIALRIKQPPPNHPTTDAIIRMKAHLMESIYNDKNAEHRWPTFSLSGIQPVWLVGRVKTAALVIAIVLIIFSSMAGTVYASQRTIPLDALYPIKIASEQVRSFLTTDDLKKINLEMNFLGNRVTEIQALAQKSPETIGPAVSDFDDNMYLVLMLARQAEGKDTSSLAFEKVAIGLAEHITTFESIEESSPEIAIETINIATNMVLNRHIEALRGLADSKPAIATEININTMHNRLSRAKASSDQAAFTEMNRSLQHFTELLRLGEEISNRASRSGTDANTVDRLNVQAASSQLDVLGTIYMNASADEKENVEKAIETSVEGYRGAISRLHSQGIMLNLPGEPSLPNEIPEKIRHKILKQGADDSVTSPDSPGSNPDEPGSGPGEPGDGPGGQGNGNDGPGDGPGGPGGDGPGDGPGGPGNGNK